MKKNKSTHKVHKEIKGFDIEINQFGELKSNLKIDDINAFLNRHVPDKRLGKVSEASDRSMEEE